MVENMKSVLLMDHEIELPLVEWPQIIFETF